VPKIEWHKQRPRCQQVDLMCRAFDGSAFRSVMRSDGQLQTFALAVEMTIS